MPTSYHTKRTFLSLYIVPKLYKPNIFLTCRIRFSPHSQPVSPSFPLFHIPSPPSVPLSHTRPLPPSPVSTADGASFGWPGAAPYLVLLRPTAVAGRLAGGPTDEFTAGDTGTALGHGRPRRPLPLNCVSGEGSTVAPADPAPLTASGGLTSAPPGAKFSTSTGGPLPTRHMPQRRSASREHAHWHTLLRCWAVPENPNC